MYVCIYIYIYREREREIVDPGRRGRPQPRDEEREPAGLEQGPPRGVLLLRRALARRALAPASDPHRGRSPPPARDILAYYVYAVIVIISIMIIVIMSMIIIVIIACAARDILARAAVVAPKRAVFVSAACVNR